MVISAGRHWLRELSGAEEFVVATARPFVSSLVVTGGGFWPKQGWNERKEPSMAMLARSASSLLGAYWENGKWKLAGSLQNCTCCCGVVGGKRPDSMLFFCRSYCLVSSSCVEQLSVQRLAVIVGAAAGSAQS